MKCALKCLAVVVAIVVGLYAVALGEAVALTILAERQSEQVADDVR